eukprot:524065-Hanusia_phi.AAC.2
MREQRTVEVTVEDLPKLSLQQNNIRTNKAITNETRHTRSELYLPPQGSNKQPRAVRYTSSSSCFSSTFHASSSHVSAYAALALRSDAQLFPFHEPFMAPAIPSFTPSTAFCTWLASTTRKRQAARINDPPTNAFDPTCSPSITWANAVPHSGSVANRTVVSALVSLPSAQVSSPTVMAVVAIPVHSSARRRCASCKECRISCITCPALPGCIAVSESIQTMDNRSTVRICIAVKGAA